MLEKYIPEQRLFLRSDTETRFIRLSPTLQAGVLFGGAVLVGWTILATSVLLIDSIGSGSAREMALREQQLYEQRLNQLSRERDRRASEARQAQERFNVALTQVSKMQANLLASEDRRRELETGIEVIQKTLRGTMKDRDAAQQNSDRLMAELKQVTGATKTGAGQQRDAEATVDFLTAALARTSDQRDRMSVFAKTAEIKIDQMKSRAKLDRERNDRVFSQLEDALTVSLTPLDKMFRAAGLPTAKILDTVRRGYSGQGGPLTPVIKSSKGEVPDELSDRANNLLGRLDKLNLYRIAAEKAPFGIPIKSAFRYTSGFGPRWGRMHKGTDFAAGLNTPIYATADGIVTYAGWSSGYGKLVKIQHEFGIETRYAHQNKLYVKKGQRVSRGDRIGAMGTTGRSTGVHLHYEVRLGGKAVNPMTYIKAAKDVF
ncbi:DUF5930 domain-containing protein [Brevirhabdus sp.]|uniref:DUF5930 domain-containing protein n=1 Tax=Brevirhabdus sp. TaxID=2004514 RepID=UPI004057D335